MIFGGPSPERGISLNSARSVMDHLHPLSIEILPLYVDSRKRFYRISTAQLYSNTPADFDFKLSQTAEELNERALDKFLKNVDLVFPLVHGVFGEDGELQALLERRSIPFIGHSSASCKAMFDKYQAAAVLHRQGFPTLPQLLLLPHQQECQKLIEQFFQQHALHRGIIKPAIGGSSIGVYSVSTPEEAQAKAKVLFTGGLHSRVILEPFFEGREFTVVVFEGTQGEPVALIPTEVELDYADHEIFDFRKKYLPTHRVAYHTPARFSEGIIDQIRTRAEQLFTLFGMRDFVRLDGWVMPDEKVVFTDINPISGLEQNSFLFRQTAVLGMTHSDTLMHILRSACRRHRLHLYSETVHKPKKSKVEVNKKPVYVVFGNRNAERQVSLMSGANVWLKLLGSHRYAPTPFLVDFEGVIWELPYAHVLHHTVEEIYAECIRESNENGRWESLTQSICRQLGHPLPGKFRAIPMTFDAFLDRAREAEAFVFLAMHGGEGEDGTWQRHLESHSLSFNGSKASTSALCMDKYLTGEAIRRLENNAISALLKKQIRPLGMERCPFSDFERFWKTCCDELSSQRLIIKPRYDGCSAGIVLLHSAQDLERYCRFLYQKSPCIPSFSFAGQTHPIEMPSYLEGDYLMEPYIETDVIGIRGHELHQVLKEGWIELTIGVLEKAGNFHALNPSITVAEGAVLSVEEKFQGGSGVNLTPPPEEILSRSATERLKRLAEEAAAALNIRNYARLDLFFNRVSEKMIVIEANTLPALTPSTVIYHQGLAEASPLTPLELLERIISNVSHD